jgi:hypothetical protein
MQPEQQSACSKASKQQRSETFQAPDLEHTHKAMENSAPTLGHNQKYTNIAICLDFHDIKKEVAIVIHE